MSQIRDAYFKEIDDLVHSFLVKVREKFPNRRMYIKPSPDGPETFWLYVEGLKEEHNKIMGELLEFCFSRDNVDYLDMCPVAEFKEDRYLNHNQYGIIV